MSYEVIMPALGMAQDTGRLVSWLRSVGDAVRADDILMEVETDKSVMEVPAGRDGFIAELRASPGQDVPVGQVIAIISAQKPGAGAAVAVAPVPPVLPVAAPTPVTTAVQTASVPPATALGSVPGGPVLASPKARRLAREAGIDLQRLAKAGLKQPFHAADIAAFQALPAEPPADMAVTMPTIATVAAVPVLPAVLTGSGMTTANVSHFAARVPCALFDAFITRMADEGGITLDARAVWASFAARALRDLSEADEMVVEVQNSAAQSVLRLSDPDMSRLSAHRNGGADQTASLILRDLTGSRIIGFTPATVTVPLLCVSRAGADFEVSLSFRDTDLSHADAFRFVSGFADSLENPLAHLI